MAAPQMTAQFGALSDIGLRRQENQDSYGYFQAEGQKTSQGHLLVVADGMGGHLGGAVASRLAVDTIIEYYQSAAGDPTEILQQAFTRASESIYQSAQERPDLANMGTTCTALAMVSNRAYLMHVGDTRAYLIRRKEIRRLTADQTWVQSMVEQGVLTSREAARHPDRNVLMQALGTPVAPASVGSVEPLPVEPQDIFLLCTDGLSSQLEDEEICDLVLAERDPQQACARLVELAKARGGDDNITVLVLKITS